MRWIIYHETIHSKQSSDRLLLCEKGFLSDGYIFARYVDLRCVGVLILDRYYGPLMENKLYQSIRQPKMHMAYLIEINLFHRCHHFVSVILITGNDSLIFVEPMYTNSNFRLNKEMFTTTDIPYEPRC